MIFEGPSMVRKINEEILELMAEDGYKISLKPLEQI